MAKIYTTVVGSGFLFGALSGGLSCVAFSSGIGQKFADPFVAAAMLGGINAALAKVDVSKRKDAFYALFFSASISFLVFAAALALYFRMRFSNVEGEWLTLLAVGIGISYVFALGAKAIRQKKKA